MNDDSVNQLMVSYPGHYACAHQNYDVADMQRYFSRFPGGLVSFVEAAYVYYLGDGLAAYHEYCLDIFDQAYQPLFDENTVDMQHYDADRKELHRRLLFLYRYAQMSLSLLSEEQIRQLKVRASYPSVDGKRIIIDVQKA